MERSWLNPNARGKGGGILFAHKYIRLIRVHGTMYDNRVIWIKMEGV